jgi:hypothetical protein
MNIFYLSHDTKVCAEMHNNKHTVKMILEYAQLLSTAHRVLDGTLTVGLSDSGRKRTTFNLNDSLDGILYAATHINHPSAIWVRQSESHYRWLFGLWIDLMDEYTFRYGKVHASARLIGYLNKPPKNIEFGNGFKEPPPAMPEDIRIPGDSIASYRNYYIKSKSHLANWKKRNVPDWYSNNA